MPEPDDATPTVIAGAAVLTADGRIQPGCLVLEGGTIAEVTTRSVRRRGANVIDAQGRLVVPGLVDLHLHGAGGASLESVVEPEQDPARESAVPRVLRHLARAGVTATHASLASDAVETMARRSRALAHWREHQPSDGAELLGAHLEGPFLSPAQAGAHDPTLLVAPAPDDVARLVETRPAMITLAPELPGALAAIRAFAAAGTVVAIGHSEAGPGEVAAAVEAGASHLTHLWSGQSSTTRSGPWRVPGLLEASLSSSGLSAEVIADGKHLPGELLEIARRCLGENLVVVSDATEGAGMPDGFGYALASVRCEVRDGVGMVVGQPAFGGSTTTLDGMLAHLCLDLGWPVPEVIEMLSARPAAVAGVGDRKGRLAAGYDADLLVLDDQLRPWRTWVRGTPALRP